jgi:peroxiredoxin
MTSALAFQMYKIHQFQVMVKPSAQGLHNGDLVPPLRAKTLDGAAVTVDFKRSKATVLYVFAPTCQWCKKNAAAIGALAAGVGQRYPVLGLSLAKQGTPEFLASHSVTFPVYTEIPKEVVQAYRLGDTPHTLVISREGRVLASWSGAYIGSLQKTIEGYFGVKL